MRFETWTGAAAACAALVLAAVAAEAGLTVGAGSSISVGPGSTLDLGCGDLTVAGSFAAGGAVVGGARDVSIQSGATLTAGSGTLELAGDWSNAGTFTAGTSTVRFTGGCSTASSTISGATTFNGLEIHSSTGKQFFLGAGETTTVLGALSMAGAHGNLLQVRSSVSGSAAFLDLAQAATASFVDIQDNHAIGQPVTLGPGSLLSGNSAGWSVSLAVPALSLIALGVLGAGLWLTGHRALRPASPERTEA